MLSIIFGVIIPTLVVGAIIKKDIDNDKKGGK